MMRREPDVVAAADASPCTSVARGPCATLAAPPARPARASAPTRRVNVTAKTRARLRRFRVLLVPLSSVLIGIRRLGDLLHGVGIDLELAVGGRSHRARDGDPLAR